MLVLQEGEGVHVGALAVEVDGENGFDGFAVEFQGLFDAGWGEVEGEGVDVGEDGAGSGAEDGAGGGEEAEGGGEDGVLLMAAGGLGAVADSGGGESKPEGVGAAGAADGVGRGAGEGGGALEGFDLGAEDEALRGADLSDGLHDLFSDGGELAGEVEKGDGLGCGSGGWRHGVNRTSVLPDGPTPRGAVTS